MAGSYTGKEGNNWGEIFFVVRERKYSFLSGAYDLDLCKERQLCFSLVPKF